VRRLVLAATVLLSSTFAGLTHAEPLDDVVSPVPDGSTEAELALDNTAYIDQLIDPTAIEADSLYPDFEDAAEPEGFRSYSTEYRHYQQDIDKTGKSYEDGLIFHARRETRDYGERWTPDAAAVRLCTERELVAG